MWSIDSHDWKTVIPQATLGVKLCLCDQTKLFKQFLNLTNYLNCNLSLHFPKTKNENTSYIKFQNFGDHVLVIMSLMVRKPEIDSILTRQVCNLRGILRRRKRKISRDLETKKFLSEEKSSEKRRITGFPGKFPVFGVVTLLPGSRTLRKPFLVWNKTQEGEMNFGDLNTGLVND